MNIFTYTHRGAAKAIAAVTMFTLFMSAFPAAFFVAEAASDLYTNAGPVNVTAATPFASTEVDASAYENLRVKFSYNAETLDGGNSADDFEYGWQVGTTKTKLGEVKGKNEQGNSAATDETGSVDLPIPSGGQASNLQIYMKVIGGTGEDDKVTVTNLKVVGDQKQTQPETPASPYDTVLDDQDQIEICHSAKGKNYVSNAPNVKAFINLYEKDDKNGHHSHQFDVIPPFNYNIGDGDKSYPGKNWSAETAAIWENGCKDADEKYASVTLLKEVTNEDGANLASFPLMLDGETYEHNDTVQVEVVDGGTSVVVTEGEVDGYTLTNVSCVENDSISTAVAIDPVTEVELSLEADKAYTCTITNEKDKKVVPEVTLKATKIVCEDESLLPNDGYQQIDANTAAAFLASSPERTEGCRLEEGWKFQYAFGGQSTESSPDNTPELGSPWVTTAATDVNGSVTVTIDEETLGQTSTISVREVTNSNYIPFTGQYGGPVSAELYCTNDAANFDNLEWIPNVDVDNTYHCVAWNAPAKATVEMCKLDEEQRPLGGWQLNLLGEKVETIVVPANDTDGVDTVASLEAGVPYVVVAEGTWNNNRGEANVVDAEYSTVDGWTTVMDGYTGFGTNILELSIDGEMDPGSDWGPYNGAHRYAQAFTPAADGTINLGIVDTFYGDNEGSLTVTIYRGYTDTTNKDTGCVTFSGVPYGTYTSDEVGQDGWANLSGLGEVVIDAPRETITVVNEDMREEPPATIVAHKIVCTDEADLPNWGTGGPAITGTTAADWVAEHDSCELVPNWEFQWAESDASNPDNQLPGTPFYGAAGAGWNTFGPTDTNGMTSVSVPAAVLANNQALWVREVLKDGFLPFTYGPSNMTNADNESAEIYCHTDVANFDNYDRVDGPESGKTYHCVAWNYELPEPLVCDPKVNLLANAGFEATPVTDAAGWDIFDLTTYPALGWMVDFVGSFDGAPDEASLELHAGVNGWVPNEGEQYAELDADWQGPAGTSGEQASVAISQVIPTIPGENYVLSWDFSPRPGTIQPENKLSVLVDGTEVEMNTAAGGANTQWTSDSYSFKATGNTTEISFADIGTPNSVGTLLDNTSLVCQPKVVTKCELEIVSDETTIVVDVNDFAVATYDNHPSWTAEEEIPGATWIWETEQVADPEGQTVRTFEETFTVNGAQNAELTVGADNTYRIFINDILFYDRSAVEPDNYQKVKVMTFDITDELIDGENKVQFEVINLPQSGGSYTTNPAGVIFKITLDGVSGCEVTTDRDPEPKTYEVSGIKWNDLDGNGARGEGEPTLPNWTIYAYNEETDEERMATTNGDGEYSFSLPAGVWEISEGNQANWYQTAPAFPGVCTFNLDEPYLSESFAFVSEVLEYVIPQPVQEGYCAFGNQFREGDDDDDEPEVDVRGSSGGSSAPRCELDVARDGAEVTVSWETSRATSIVLSANGDEVVESSDDDVVDGDSYTMDLTEDTTFELVAKRGSRERTCTVDVPLDRPEGAVLGEQVSIVPLGAADAGAGGTSTTGFGSLLLAGAYAGRGRRNG